MPTYRKRPVEIEARQLTSDITEANEIGGWIADQGVVVASPTDDGVRISVHIKTLEGEMVAHPGDWIIRGVQGEFYPCKHEIFVETYEPVEEQADA